MTIYKPVSAELSMDSTVYESKKKFSYQASEAKDQIMNNRILANLVPMCGFEPLTPYSIE